MMHLPTFHDNAFAGLGSIAVLVQADTKSWNDTTLYTVLNRNVDGKRIVHHFRIADHVIMARFSPDGEWMIVSVDKTKPGALLSQTSTWLMSATGSTKTELSNKDYLPGTWLPRTDTYVYGQNPVYAVRPGHEPVRLNLKLPANVTVSDLYASPTGQQVEMVATYPAPGKDVTSRYDKLGVWRPSTGVFTPIITATESNGYVGGPWSMGGSGFFYWPDPLHSGSLLADGTQLSWLSTSGRQAHIAITLTGAGSVTPTENHSAVVQVGGGREYFHNKSVAIWSGAQLTAIPHQLNTVQVWPDSTPDGRTIVYADGPELTKPLPTERDTQAWWTKLKLAVYHPGDKSATVLSRAGAGAWPKIDSTGERIVYVSGHQLRWINANGDGFVHVIADTGGPTAYGYPQAGSGGSLTVADYLPAAHTSLDSGLHKKH